MPPFIALHVDFQSLNMSSNLKLLTITRIWSFRNTGMGTTLALLEHRTQATEGDVHGHLKDLENCQRF